MTFHFDASTRTWRSASKLSEVTILPSMASISSPGCSTARAAPSVDTSCIIW